MTKRMGIFVSLIAVTALGLSVTALLIKQDERRVLNNTFDMIHQHIVDGEFAEIIQRYDEDPE